MIPVKKKKRKKYLCIRYLYVSLLIAAVLCQESTVLVAFLQHKVATEVCGSHAEKPLISDDPMQFPQDILWELRCLF